MTVDFNKAFEVEKGIILSRDGAYLTGGSVDPTGLDAPAGTWYLRIDTRQLWLKFNTGVNDWRQVSAEDIRALDTSEVPALETTVQSILTQLLAGDTPAVSQTQIFGNGGNTAQNSYIENQGVQSNVVGVPVGLTNAAIRSIFLGNENTKTGNVLIQERSPAGTGTYTTVYTLSLVSQSYANITGLNIPVTTNAEIAIFTEVSLKNVKIVLNINGDSAS